MAFRKTAISLAALAAVAATPAATAFAQQAEPERATEKPTICSTVAWVADSTGVNLKKPGTGVITNDGTIREVPAANQGSQEGHLRCPTWP